MKQHKNKVKNRTIKPLYIVIALLITAQIGFNAYLYIQSRRVTDTTIISLLASAVEGLHKPAPVDPKTGDSYFPEARMYVTVQSDTPELLYNYTDFDDEKSLSVTAANVVNASISKLYTANANHPWDQEAAVTAVFDQVPSLQACSRGAQVYFKAQSNSDYQNKLTLKLSDGRRAYVYTEPTCKQDLSPVLNALKTLKSY